MADLFKTAGADRLMAVDLHTAQIQGFFDGPVDHLCALPMLAELRAQAGRRGPGSTVVSPGRRPGPGGRALVGPARRRPLAFIHKTRDPSVPNEVRSPTGSSVTCAGRICVLVDDMIDTGGTIVKAAEALMDDGAADVIIAATHAVLSGPAVDRLKNCRISRGRRHQHAADPPRSAVRQAHRALDRPADRPGDPRGLRRRLGDQPVRRPRLIRSALRRRGGGFHRRDGPRATMCRLPRRGLAAA